MTEKEIKRELIKEGVWLNPHPDHKIMLRRHYNVVTEEPLDKIRVYHSIVKETPE